MTFFHLVIVLAVIGGSVALAAGRVRGGLAAPTSTLPDLDLPPGEVAPTDVDGVRFSVGFRGYRMDEVDQVLDRLGAEIGRRDEEIRTLRAQLDPAPLEPAPLEPAPLDPIPPVP